MLGIGAILGGSQGVMQAVRSKPEAGLTDTARLRVNRFLNMTGRSGRTAGNALGVLGLFFAGFESFGLTYWTDGRVPDSVNSVAAGEGLPPPPPPPGPPAPSFHLVPIDNCCCHMASSSGQPVGPLPACMALCE